MSNDISLELINQNIKSGLNNFRKINDLLLFDNDNEDLNEALKDVINEVLVEIEVVNVVQPGYYSQESIEQFKSYNAEVEDEETKKLNYDKIKVLYVSMDAAVTSSNSNLNSNERNIFNKIITALGDNFTGFNDFYLEIKNLLSQVSEDTDINSYYTKLKNILKDLYQKGYISYCLNTKKIILKFKLYRFSPKLIYSAPIKICLDISTQNVNNLYANLEKILNKIFTIVKLINNFNAY